jgi:hypothetical protein
VRRVLAATPTWFAGNLTQISLGTLLVLTLVVIRMVHAVITKVTLLTLIVLLALFVYVNRAPLKACAQTCECEIAGKHLTVPTCDSHLKL